MADENPGNLPLKIGILIGCVNYWEFMTGDSRRGESGPVGIGSRLGYILSRSIERGNCSCCCVSHVCKNSKSCRSNLLKIYGNEELQTYNEDDIKVLQLFDKCTNFNDNNRYKVRLPFKFDPDLIGDNYKIAYNILWSLLKQFQMNKILVGGVQQSHTKSAERWCDRSCPHICT